MKDTLRVATNVETDVRKGNEPRECGEQTLRFTSIRSIDVPDLRSYYYLICDLIIAQRESNNLRKLFKVQTKPSLS